MTTASPKVQKLMEALETDPIAAATSTAELAKRFKLTTNKVSNTRGRLARTGRLAKASKGGVEIDVERHRRNGIESSKVKLDTYPKPQRIEIELPDGGIELKITRKNMIGTLVITESGVRYVAAKAKIRPARELPWSVLCKLLTSGILD